MEFTSWDAGFRSNELEHHGIPGMKWHVRRYQNADGTLTELGKRRYGVTDTGTGGKPKRTGAKKMTKDLNSLDQGYANVVARQAKSINKVVKYQRKANKAAARGNTKRYEKMHNKAMKNANKASEANKQKNAVESLQWKIIGKAAKKGYKINSEPVERTAKRGFRYAKKTIDGQQFTVSRKGTGGSGPINYKNASRIAAEERERERRKQIAYARRG